MKLYKIKHTPTGGYYVKVGRGGYSVSPKGKVYKIKQKIGSITITVSKSSPFYTNNQNLNWYPSTIKNHVNLDTHYSDWIPELLIDVEHETRKHPEDVIFDFEFNLAKRGMGIPIIGDVPEHHTLHDTFNFSFRVEQKDLDKVLKLLKLLGTKEDEYIVQVRVISKDYVQYLLTVGSTFGAYLLDLGNLRKLNTRNKALVDKDIIISIAERAAMADLYEHFACIDDRGALFFEESLYESVNGDESDTVFKEKYQEFFTNRYDQYMEILKGSHLSSAV